MSTENPVTSHPASAHCIVLTTAAGSPAYLRWLDDETHG